MTDELLKKGHIHIDDKVYKPVVCPVCKGYGKTMVDHTTTGGHLWITCNRCGGEGEI